jgi:hypothetical protein
MNNKERGERDRERKGLGGRRGSRRHLRFKRMDPATQVGAEYGKITRIRANVKHGTFF